MPFPDPPNPVFPASFGTDELDQRYVLDPPFSTVPGDTGDITTQAFGDTPNGGATGSLADAGHRHGMPSTETVAIEFVIDGGGAAITTGVKGDIEIPFAWSNISAARLFADQAGDIVVNIWKDTYANFPPTAADKITASAPPTLSAAAKSEDTTLTGWTKTGAAGDILRFNVDSVATVQRVTVSLTVTRVLPA